MLCGNVGCLARYGAECHRRCDMYDSAATESSLAESFRADSVRMLFGHYWCNRFGEEKGSSSVHVEDAGEVFVRSQMKGYDGLHVNLNRVC
jgi:hypothetical protein